MVDSCIYVICQENVGFSVVCNCGVQDVQGVIICFCDVDDLWVEIKFKQLVDVFLDICIDGVYGKIVFFEWFGYIEIILIVVIGFLMIFEFLGENLVCIMSNIFVWCEVIIYCGGFVEGFVYNEDFEWLICFVGLGVVIQLMDDLYVWYCSFGVGLFLDLCKMVYLWELVLIMVVCFGYVFDVI